MFNQKEYYTRNSNRFPYANSILFPNTNSKGFWYANFRLRECDQKSFNKYSINIYMTVCILDPWTFENTSYNSK